MPFEKGESGNPAGRPLGSKNKNTIPTPKEIDSEIQRYGLRAIKKLVKQMDDKKVSPTIQQKNAMWLAEQYYKIEDLKRTLAEAENSEEEPQEPSQTTEERPSVVVSLKSIS